MPLRDHFHRPLDDLTSWDGVHGGWPMKITERLNQRLPRRYVAAPHVHLGSSIEVDVAAFDGGPAPGGAGAGEGGDPGWLGPPGGGDPGGVATAVWAPPEPTLAVATEAPESDEYGVRVYDARRGRRLVAAVELVSPSNKDRPEQRRAFATKCAALLWQGVCVAVVDVVTGRASNLYGEVLGLLRMSDPSLGDEPPPTYAASCRWTHARGVGRLQAWARALEVGRPLPTLPLWLAPDLAVPLELEESYEEACRALRIP